MTVWQKLSNISSKLHAGSDLGPPSLGLRRERDKGDFHCTFLIVLLCFNLWEEDSLPTKDEMADPKVGGPTVREACTQCVPWMMVFVLYKFSCQSFLWYVQLQLLVICGVWVSWFPPFVVLHVATLNLLCIPACICGVYELHETVFWVSFLIS